MAWTPRNGDAAVLGAAARDPDVEAGRLADDRRVGAEPALDEGGAARAGRLLVGVGGDDEVAGERHPELRQRLGGDRHCGDPALHVARAATVEESVPHLGGERIARPAIARLDGDGVDVPVEDERAAAARTAAAGDQLRPTAEVEPGWDERLPGECRGVRLPEVDLGSGAFEPAREVLLERRLLSRRVPLGASGRVEADQRRGELHEVVAALRDRLADAKLDVGGPVQAATVTRK